MSVTCLLLKEAFTVTIATFFLMPGWQYCVKNCQSRSHDNCGN